MVEMRVVQERLRRYAADVETCSAKGAALFYACNLGEAFVSIHKFTRRTSCVP